MNFLADESVDQPIVVRLRDDGHDVVAVAEIAPAIPDTAVLAQANQRGDLLLTADKDFAGFGFGFGVRSCNTILLKNPPFILREPQDERRSF